MHPEGMTKAYTAQQIRDAEAHRLAAGEPLMQRAAEGLARVIEEVLVSRGAPVAGRVLLLVGSGNNGGDALFAGARLAASGQEVLILPVGSRMHEVALEAALTAGATLATDEGAGRSAPLPGEVERLGRSVHVIVDAILGIGAAGSGAGTGAAGSPALRPRARAVVQALLPVVRGPQAPAVVAVDIPSGIGPDDGAVPNEAVLPADVTVTFGGLKVGLLREPARRLAGRVVLVDVGLDEELADMTPALDLPDP